MKGFLKLLGSSIIVTFQKTTKIDELEDTEN